jgi:DNA-binding NarL/FixJ family response regulator
MPERRPTSEDDTTTRVLVVARDERFRRTMRTRLSTLEQVHVTGEAADSNAAAIICVLGHPDVVVMDADLPWHEGSDIVRHVRRAAPGARIVACSWSASASAVAVLVAGPTVEEGFGGGLAAPSTS